MIKIVIVYHSGYGHTKNQVEAVLSGASTVTGCDVNIIAISMEGDLSESDWTILDEADAIIFGSPSYMGMVSWQFKKFADHTSKRWVNQVWKNKIAAGFTNSASINGDKHSTIHYLVTLAMQHSMLWVGTGMLPANTKNAQWDDINYLASFAGLMAQSPSDASAEEAPPLGDIETAKLFGQRIAETAKRWRKI